MRVVRAESALIVAGPGRKRWTYAFTSETELTTFQISMEQRLRMQGWHLEGEIERRRIPDRRVVPRYGNERRATDRA
jgi:hypothetical protein